MMTAISVYHIFEKNLECVRRHGTYSRKEFREILSLSLFLYSFYEYVIYIERGLNEN